MEFVKIAYDLDVIERPEYLKMLAFSGDLLRLKALYEKERAFPIGIAFSATLGGHLDIVKWLQEKEEDMSNVMHCAAQIGNIEILSWGLSNTLELDNICMYRAIKYSSLKTVKWLLDHKCPIDGSAYIGALQNYDLEKLEFLFSIVPFELELEMAILDKERVDSLEWLWTRGHQVEKNLGIVALIERKVKILEWLKKKDLLDIPDDIMRMLLLREQLEQ